jgi:hypothetical protein
MATAFFLYGRYTSQSRRAWRHRKRRTSRGEATVGHTDGPTVGSSRCSWGVDLGAEGVSSGSQLGERAVLVEEVGLGRDGGGLAILTLLSEPLLEAGSAGTRA